MTSHPGSLDSPRFPRSSRYHPDWIRSNVSGGAHSLWLTEWLSEVVDLLPGMRMLDLGCGRGASSVFLRREFGIQVWSTDLWFSVDVQRADAMDEGWRLWLRWQQAAAPDNEPEIHALEADRGRYLGYRRRHGVELDDRITSIPVVYQRQPLLVGDSLTARRPVAPAPTPEEKA